MKKHLFTIRWEREHTRAYPTFEAYLAFDWPDSVPPDVALQAAAKVRGVSMDTVQKQVVASLSPECKEAMKALFALHLRCRYSPETEGPYMVIDPDDSLTEEQLLTWIEHSTEQDLRAFRV